MENWQYRKAELSFVVSEPGCLRAGNKTKGVLRLGVMLTAIEPMELCSLTLVWHWSILQLQQGITDLQVSPKEILVVCVGSCQDRAGLLWYQS